MQNRIWIVVEVAVLAVATAAVALATLVTPGSTPKPPQFSPPVLGGQPDGAVILPQEDKDLAVALALKPQPGGLLAIVTAIGQDGAGTSGLDAEITVKTADGNTVSAHATPGDEGTYQATLRTSGRPLAAIVTIHGGGSTNHPLDFALPAAWPPRPATQLMQHVARVYQGLTSLITHERLASDPTHAINTTYQAIAPSTLRIKSSNGIQAVVIRTHRWDKTPGGAWRESAQNPPIAAIAPYWAGAIQDPTLLGSTSIDGRAAWIVSFAAPQMPAFFQIDVDKQTGRVLDLQMTASAHFMHHVYGPFDTKLTITPPK